MESRNLVLYLGMNSRQLLDIIMNMILSILRCLTSIMRNVLIGTIPTYYLNL